MLEHVYHTVNIVPVDRPKIRKAQVLKDILLHKRLLESVLDAPQKIYNRVAERSLPSTCSVADFILK